MNNLMDHSSVLLAPYLNALRLLGIPAPAHEPSKIEPGQYTAQPGTVAAKAAEAVMAGRDPLDDPEVTRLIMAERLTAVGLYEAVKAAEDRAYVQTFKDAAPGIREQIIKQFDTAVQDMQTGADALGYFDMDAPLTVTADLDPEAAALTASTMRAHHTVETIRQQWGHMLTIDSGMPLPSEQMAPLLWLDLSADELAAYHQDRNKIVADTNTPAHRMPTRTSWDALRDGYDLKLAKDAGEFGKRVERVEREWNEAREAARARAQARGSIVL